MKKRTLILAGVIALGTAGCAQQAVKPIAVETLDPTQKSLLRISDVTAETAWGVTLMPSDLQHIAGDVKGTIQQTIPGIIVSPPGSASRLKIVITYYDPGTASTSFWGRGQRSDIQITANIFIVDPAGKTIGEYKVSKDVSTAGILGGTTEGEDVEEGFAKSVAAILSLKA